MVVDILKGTDKKSGIFVDDSRLRLNRNDTDKSIIIKETQKDAKLKKVTICDISEQTVGIKMDAYGKNICNFFNNGRKNINKGSDALIYTKCVGSLYENTKFLNEKYIIIIDLKSNAPKGFDLQMKSTKAFTEYVKAIFNEFYTDNDLANFKTIFVLFSSKNKIKSYTRRKNDKYGKVREKNGVKYLDCHAYGDKSVFHLKKIIEEYTA